MTLGEKIRYLRKRLGITQEVLAHRAGMHPVSIRKYEINKMFPQVHQAKKLAAALEVSVDELLDGVEEVIYHNLSNRETPTEVFTETPRSDPKPAAASRDQSAEAIRARRTKKKIKKKVPIDIEIELTEADIFNWLSVCQDPEALKSLSRSALRFAAALEPLCEELPTEANTGV